MERILTYSQTTGAITDPAGKIVAGGWAGNGAGKNNPLMQDQHNVGPLPQGLYKVGPWEDYHPHLGPFVAPLTQVEGETFGRSAFYIHGPATDPDHYGQESKGCIVIPRPMRLKVKGIHPDFIRVTA